MERRGGRGYGGVGRLRLHTYHYTVTTRMTSALRWAAMRALLMFHCEGQSHKTVSTDPNFWRERRAEADLKRGPSAYQPNALPLGQTGSLSNRLTQIISDVSFTTDHVAYASTKKEPKSFESKRNFFCSFLPGADALRVHVRVHVRTCSCTCSCTCVVVRLLSQSY